MELRSLAPRAVPAGACAPRPAGLLCVRLLHRRAEQQLLPLAPPGGVPGLAGQAAGGLRLSVKAPRGLTHARKLYAPEAWLARIAVGWHELGEKRAVLLVQLPPSSQLFTRMHPATVRRSGPSRLVHQDRPGRTRGSLRWLVPLHPLLSLVAPDASGRGQKAATARALGPGVLAGSQPGVGCQSPYVRIRSPLAGIGEALLPSAPISNSARPLGVTRADTCQLLPGAYLELLDTTALGVAGLQDPAARVLQIRDPSSHIGLQPHVRERDRGRQGHRINQARIIQHRGVMD